MYNDTLMAKEMPDLIGKRVLRSDAEILKTKSELPNEPFYNILHRILVEAGIVKER